MKKAILLSLTLVFLFLASQAFAQSYRTDSNTVTTTVGTGGTSPGSGNTLAWAEKIHGLLELATDNSYSKLPTAVVNDAGYTSGIWAGTGDSNRYWCTYLVIDSFNLAGVTGATKGGQGSVIGLMGYFKTTPGYTYIDFTKNKKEALLQIKPGFAVFSQLNPGSTGFGSQDHASMLREVSIDPETGNGFIQTYDSNTSIENSIKYIVDNWVITRGIPSTPVGFGTAQ